MPNIADFLIEMAERFPDRPAIVLPGGRAAPSHLTYRTLHERTRRIARGLGRHGISKGTRTALMVTPGPDFFALTFALFSIGAVLVMVDPGIGRHHLKTCLNEAAPEGFIGVPKAQIARLLFGWARGSVRRSVTVGRAVPGAGPTLWEIESSGAPAGALAAEDAARTGPDDVAAILFTSGSTGTPKGAVYTHGNFLAQVRMIRDLYGIEPGEIDVPTFPLFGLFDPALGMTTVVPEMDASRPGSVDPRKIVSAVADFGATNLFGSPALLDRVGRYGERNGVKLPSLLRVISAGAPVPPRVLERFASMLSPGVQIFTPYGATEALPVASIGSHEILGGAAAGTRAGRGVCVGRQVAGMDVRVIRILDDEISNWQQDLELAAGQIGEIAVKGPPVTRSYFARDGATRLAKIVDGEGFWHRMGDVGYRDGDGRLWYCGRKSHRVKTADGTLFTECCEGVFNAHPEVLRTALVEVAGEGALGKPVLCVELENRGASRSVKERIRRELLALGQGFSHTRTIVTVLFHPAFPVDIRHNAKIFREKLAVWASRELAS